MERQFDSRFGVSTSGRIDRWDLGVTGANLLNAVEYRPTPVDAFIRIIGGLDIKYEDWVFVDLGAGKGRALLLASHFPFRQIIGVEFSPELAEVAKKNLCRYSNPQQKCHNLTILCKDATEFSFPLNNVVLYLNNPFDGAVMKRVLDNIDYSLIQNPRGVRIVYWNPFSANLFEKRQTLVKTENGTQYCLYRSSASAI